MEGDGAQTKRMSKRVDVSYPAFFNLGGATIDGVVRQISEGGLIFCCARRIPMNVRGDVTLNVFDAGPDVSFGGVVIYELPGGRREGVKWKYGIRFVDADKASMEALSKVIRYAALRESYLPNKGPEGEDVG